MTASRTIVILAEDGFRDEEAIYPYYRLKEAGVSAIIAADDKKEVVGKYGVPLRVDADLNAVKSAMIDGIIIPGGLNCPDKLRMKPAVIKLVQEINKQGKLVGAICHGGWVLASADIIAGKNMTGYAAIKDDLKHAGAKYADKDVVVDGNIITSRNPSDLPAFMREVLRFLEK